MTGTQPHAQQQDRYPQDPDYKDIRDVYEEYRVGQTTWAMISDPMEPRGWYQSTVTVPIRQ